MLQLLQVTKTYNGKNVVDQVDLTFQARRTHVLIGPSGCGKSTLLRMLLGLIEPDSGQVLIDGVPLGSQDLHRVRRRFGYVIQDGGLFPHLTARQNIELAARFLKWPLQDVSDRINELAELTEFPNDGLDRFPAQLSGGQRQRVSLMRSLMLDPDVLLLDEPLGALDPMIRRQLQGALRAIFKRLNKTVVLVTHDLHEAAFFADQIVLMRSGSVVQIGALSELMESPSEPFVSQFVSAQRSLIAANAAGES